MKQSFSPITKVVEETYTVGNRTGFLNHMIPYVLAALIQCCFWDAPQSLMWLKKLSPSTTVRDRRDLFEAFHSYDVFVCNSVLFLGYSIAFTLLLISCFRSRAQFFWYRAPPCYQDSHNEFLLTHKCGRLHFWNTLEQSLAFKKNDNNNYRENTFPNIKTSEASHLLCPLAGCIVS